MAYTREEREAMREELFDYLREHPGVMRKALPEKYLRTLAREHISISRAREEAGVPEPDRDDGLGQELEDFRKYMDRIYDGGGTVTKTDLDGTRWSALLSRFNGSINELKRAADRPEYAQAGKKRGSRHARRKNEESPYQRHRHKVFGR